MWRKAFKYMNKVFGMRKAWSQREAEREKKTCKRGGSRGFQV